MINARIRFPKLQALFAGFLLLIRLVVKVCEDRTVSPRFWVSRVYRENFFQEFAGRIVLLGIDHVIGFDKQGGCVSTVVFERGFDGLDHFYAIARRVSFGQTAKNVWVIGTFL